MDGIQAFKKATFCVKNLVNRPAIHYDFCLECDIFYSLSCSPRINRDTLNIKTGRVAVLSLDMISPFLQNKKTIK